LKFEYFKTAKGRAPYIEWFESLEDRVQYTIDNYLHRILFGGSKKNVKHIFDEIYEIKIHIGPGHRIYFAKVDESVILLITGGDKRTQNRDIEKAIEYWRDYGKKK